MSISLSTRILRSVVLRAATPTLVPAAACRAAVAVFPGPGAQRSFASAAPRWAGKEKDVGGPKVAKDEAIIPLFPLVSLVDTQTNALTGPFAPRDVLRQVDRSTHYLQLVAPDAQPYPIVKLISKAAVFAKAKASKAKASAKPKVVEKEIQLTWAVAPHDLAHKLKKARQVLENGGGHGRVSVVFTASAGSKGKGKVPVETQERLVGLVEQELGLPEGRAKRWKDTERRGQMWAVHLMGVEEGAKEENVKEKGG